MIDRYSVQERNIRWASEQLPDQAGNNRRAVKLRFAVRDMVTLDGMESLELEFYKEDITPQQRYANGVPGNQLLQYESHIRRMQAYREKFPKRQALTLNPNFFAAGRTWRTLRYLPADQQRRGLICSVQFIAAVADVERVHAILPEYLRNEAEKIHADLMKIFPHAHFIITSLRAEWVHGLEKSYNTHRIRPYAAEVIKNWLPGHDGLVPPDERESWFICHRKHAGHLIAPFWATAGYKHDNQRFAVPGSAFLTTVADNDPLMRYASLTNLKYRYVVHHTPYVKDEEPRYDVTGPRHPTEEHLRAFGLRLHPF